MSDTDGSDESRRPAGGPRHATSRPASPGPARPWYRRLRPRSVRAKVVVVLMVPVISLLALWAYVTVTIVQDVAAGRDFREVDTAVLTPLRGFVEAVQEERAAASEHLAGDGAAAGDVTTAGRRSAAAADALEGGIAAARTEAAEADMRIPAMMDAAMESAAGLEPLRESVLAGELSWQEAYDRYTGIIDAALGLQGGLSGVTVPDGATDPRISYELAYGREMIARADAVMAAAAAGGSMTAEQYAEFAGAAAAGDAFLSLVPGPQEDAAVVEQVGNLEALADLRSYGTAVVESGPGEAALAAVPAADWSSTADTVLADLAAAGVAINEDSAEPPGLLPPGVLGTAGLVVFLGLAGVILSLLVSVYIGRGLLRELIGLRNAATELAARKLPDALRRLNTGDEVDIEAEAPRAGHGEDEISQVGEALNAVHRAAINAAIERSHLASGIAGVYVHLARRSQLLLHRQLGLLDTMERRVEDPEDLEDLFRLDHLTTRMRRHAESLIILSGNSPARQWRYPVPVLDVVRAAVAEVEDFTRVDVRDLPDVRIIGGSVADLTHLIAELAENAVSFAPPDTKAIVRGQLVGSGLAVEIEDRGLGMTDEGLADANRRVRDEAQVDLLDADQLGLFVVNRLAHRQKIEVTLQRSPYGGVTAVVLIPNKLLDHESTPVNRQAPASPARPRPAGGPRRRESPWQFIDGVPATGGTNGSAETNGLSGHVTGTPPADGEPATDGVSAADGDPDGTTLPKRVAVPVSRRGLDGEAEPDGARAGPGAAEPADRASPPEPNGSSLPAGAEQTTNDLPRRVRQANLAPELRDGTRDGAGDPGAAARTPDEARARLDALRSGWLRGRTESDDLSGKQ